MQKKLIGLNQSLISMFLVDKGREMLESDILKCFADVNPRILSSFLKGLYEMDYKWSEGILMNEAVYEKIEAYFSSETMTKADGMELSRPFSNILYYLAKLGAKWDRDFSPAIQSALYNGIGKGSLFFSARDATMIIYS
jgi:hypothetical protein